MKKVDQILSQFAKRTGQIAVLIDPEKSQDEVQLKKLVEKADFAKVDYFFVGGSTVLPEEMNAAIKYIKSLSKTPVVIFPGDHQQINSDADGLLYLSLLSGRNPEYLIGQHVVSARQVFELKNVEIIPTAYILIDGGTSSTVAYVSQTTPIPRDKTSIAVNTALAGILQGKKVVYFDSGSGAKLHVPVDLVGELKKLNETIPVIIGGGIREVEQIEELEKAGANIIVIGNHIEENIDFLLELNSYVENQKG